MPSLQTRRRGTTAVEVAFILPVFLTFVFAIFEYGRSVMVSNLLQCACRNAARAGATEGVTTQQTIDRVEQYLSGAIDTDSLTVVVKNASVWDTTGPYPDTASEFNALPAIELSGSSQRQLFLVRATVNYSEVSLTSLPFFQGMTLTAQSFMRHE